MPVPLGFNLKSAVFHLLSTQHFFRAVFQAFLVVKLKLARSKGPKESAEINHRALLHWYVEKLDFLVQTHKLWFRFNFPEIFWSHWWYSDHNHLLKFVRLQGPTLISAILALASGNSLSAKILLRVPVFLRTETYIEIEIFHKNATFSFSFSRKLAPLAGKQGPAAGLGKSVNKLQRL